MKKLTALLLVLAAILAMTAFALAESDSALTGQVMWADMLGKEVGTLTVMPEANEWQLYYETRYGNYTVKGTYTADGSMTVTNDGGLGNHLEWNAIYESARPVLLELASSYVPSDAPAAAPASSDVLTAEVIWADQLGKEVGKMTVKPASQEWEIYYATRYGDATVTGTYEADGAMTLVSDGGVGARLPWNEIYESARPILVELLSSYVPSASQPADVTAEALTADIAWADAEGRQNARLTVNPDTKEWEITFENQNGSYAPKGTYEAAFDMTATDDAGLGSHINWDDVFAAAKPALLELIDIK